MQAAMETLVWPDGVSRPEFRTVNEGKTMARNGIANAARHLLISGLHSSQTIVPYSSTAEKNS
jgi:hypothetical protein